MHTRQAVVPRLPTFQRISDMEPSSIGSTPRLSITKARPWAARSHGSNSVMCIMSIPPIDAVELSDIGSSPSPPPNRVRVPVLFVRGIW